MAGSLAISHDRFNAIFGAPTYTRGRQTFALDSDRERREAQSAERRAARERWAAIFGEPDGRRGVMRVHPFTGRLTWWDEFEPDARKAWRDRQRTAPTRTFIIRDIDPFMTGRGPGAQYIGGRRQKREFMEATGLVEFEEIPEAPEWAPNEDDVVASIKRALDLDPLEHVPAHNQPRANDVVDGVGIDESLAEVFA